MNKVSIVIICLISVVVSAESEKDDAIEKALENAATENTFGFSSHHYGCHAKVQSCNLQCCNHRKKQNQCKKNPRVKRYCKKTCGDCKTISPVCRDKYTACRYWKPYCNSYRYYRFFVSHNCPRTCGHCDVKGKWGECSRSCGSGIQKRCDGFNKCQKRPCNTHTCEPCSNDVMFVIDQSDSVSAAETTIIRNVLIDIVGNLENIPNRHFGVIDFSNTFNIRIPLSVFPTAAALQNALSTVTLSNTGPGSSLTPAMEAGIAALLASPNFGRSCNEPQIMFISQQPFDSFPLAAIVSNGMHLTYFWPVAD